MRLLYALPSLNPADGGMVEAVRGFALAQQAAGHEVQAVSLDAPGAPGVAEFPALATALGPPRLGYGYTPRYVPWLRAHAREFDAVIVNGLWQFTGLGARRALRGTGTPYFVFPHGMLDATFKRRHPLKHLKKWLYWPWAEYRVLRDARAVLYTCEEEQRQARGSFSLYRCHEEIAALGCPEPPLEPERQLERFLESVPQARGRRVLLFLGRLHEKKGCDLLLRAFGEWQRAAPAGDWHLVMAGPCSDDAYLSALRQLAEAHCPPNSVSFPGLLRDDQKWGAFAACEAFALPSHQENFGIAVVEALACGVPVLISDQVNIWREIHADGAAVVEPDTYAGTLDLLRRWVALDLAARDAMRNASRRCFEARYRAETAGENLIEVLRKCAVAQAGGAPRP